MSVLMNLSSCFVSAYLLSISLCLLLEKVNFPLFLFAGMLHPRVGRKTCFFGGNWKWVGAWNGFFWVRFRSQPPRSYCEKHTQKRSKSLRQICGLTTSISFRLGFSPLFTSTFFSSLFIPRVSGVGGVSRSQNNTEINWMKISLLCAFHTTSPYLFFPAFSFIHFMRLRSFH